MSFSNPDIHAKLRQALNDTDPAGVQLLARLPGKYI